MKIIRAKILGYCMGVRRAVETAQKALSSGTRSPIYTLGPLIHNPSVLNSLRQKGLSILEEGEIEKIQAPSTVIIRAHGTTPSVLKALEAGGHEVLDATCPRVLLSQKRASEYAGKGFTVIIAGDRNHGEVAGIAGYAQGNAVVIENEKDARELDTGSSAVLIAQTTFSPELFERITEILKAKNPDLVVFNSICSATRERQKALQDIGGSAEGLLVIGGKNSANTRRLYEAGAKLFKTAALIETADEIPSEFFAMKSVAVTAGASTPDEIIAEVEKKLNSGEKS